MGAVLALFLITVFIIVILTARKAPPPAFTDKVIDLPPTHKPPPPYSGRAPAVPLGVHASQVAWLCQTRRAERRHELAEGQRPSTTRPGASGAPGPHSRLEWVCHQSGTERVYINHREHYTRRAERRHELAEGQRPSTTRPGASGAPGPHSRLEWVCHQSGTERVYINHREHYV
ncbi:unnamed protein product [Tetraodon nigroviridis]|uniref:Chromosome 7 SCAF14703, whole genome shotgun sequence n=1 Tax=Tetraodon nigroviridis TaxID=99883 RepID=Q4S8T2_TETNG|nr:unnamed protein product [Tetraodon nigroviridis]